MSAENLTATPIITINGKVIKPKPPKMGVYRKFLELNEADKGQMTVAEYVDKNVDLIVLAFNAPEVTKESLDEVLDVSEVIPLSKDLFDWVQAQVFEGLNKLPNSETAAEK